MPRSEHPPCARPVFIVCGAASGMWSGPQAERHCEPGCQAQASTGLESRAGRKTIETASKPRQSMGANAGTSSVQDTCISFSNSPMAEEKHQRTRLWLASGGSRPRLWGHGSGAHADRLTQKPLEPFGVLPACQRPHCSGGSTARTLLTRIGRGGLRRSVLLGAWRCVCDGETSGHGGSD